MSHPAMKKPKAKVRKISKAKQHDLWLKRMLRLINKEAKS